MRDTIPPRPPIGPSVTGAVAEADEQGPGFRDYLHIVLGHKWILGLCIAIAVALSYVSFLTADPVYQAQATMQLEKRDSGGGLANLVAFQDLAESLGQTVSVAAEIEVMRSRSIMEAVAERLNLTIQAVPNYLSAFGKAIARRYTDDSSVARAWFNQEGYAWGGEQIEVGTLEVPDQWIGKPLTLVAAEKGDYGLYDDTGALILEGRVGTRAEGALAAGGRLLVFVAYLRARPGTAFTLLKMTPAAVATSLRGRFSAAEQPSYSGIVQAGFADGDPGMAAKILNEILNTYQRQNVEQKSAQAEQTLAFLEQQLPPLRERLSAAEAAYNGYRAERGSIDIARETQDVLNGVVAAESELFTLQQKREELRQLFKPTHPKIQSLDRLIESQQAKLTALESKMQTLPDVQQTVLQLARDVEVNTKLYSSMLNSAQELRIAKAGAVGSARIIDHALPPSLSSSPVLKKNLLGGGLAGLFLGLAIVFVKIKLRNGVDDPAQIERQLGLSVYGTVPFSTRQQKLFKEMKKKKAGVRPLALQAPNDLAVESLRSLRTSLHFMLLDACNNVLLITGASADVGKSFISLNLAIVLAQAGKRVLLIDADLRRGHLNAYLGVPSGGGLSEYVAGTAEIADLVQGLEDSGLDFITAGSRPPNPSELLMHARFADLVQTVAGEYDYVIIDAPPILAVTDAAIVGRLAGASLLVARAGRHEMRELEEAVKRLQQAGVKIRGFVFNGVDLSRGYGYRSGYGYGYGYRYRYENYGYGDKSKD